MPTDPISSLFSGAGQALGAAAGGPNVSGLTDLGPTQATSGQNIFSFDGSLKNVGQILQAFNSGSAVTGARPMFPQSPITALNTDGSPVRGTIGLKVGSSSAGINIGGLLGIGAAGLAAFLFLRNR